MNTISVELAESLRGPALPARHPDSFFLAMIRRQLATDKPKYERCIGMVNSSLMASPNPSS